MANVADAVHFVHPTRPGCQAAIVNKLQSEQGSNAVRLLVFPSDDTMPSNVSGSKYDATMTQPGSYHYQGDHA